MSAFCNRCNLQKTANGPCGSCGSPEFRLEGETMPLKKGGKKPETIKKNIATNIQQLVKDGTPHNQAVAIAMDIAEQAKKKSR